MGEVPVGSKRSGTLRAEEPGDAGATRTYNFLQSLK